MFAFRLVVFSLLFCGTSAFTRHLFNFFNNCNPPQKLVGKFCAELFDNDPDGDGFVTNKDFDYDGIMYQSDDELCGLQKWEVVTHWTCRFGYSEEYGRFMFNRWDSNNDGVVDGIDFAGTFRMASGEFLLDQYRRYKDDYCSVPENRNNPVDRVMCAEVDALRPEDVKCI